MINRSACFAATAAALLFVGSAADADIVRQLPACNPGCVDLPSGVGGFFTARSVNVNAPRAGTLIVSFQGTLYCFNNSNSFSNIWIESQIVPDNDQPGPAGPSGLEFFASLEPSNGGSRTLTFSLASHRVFRITTAGTYTYRMRLRRGGISNNAGCSVRYGSFTTDFRQ